jgi:hypothetical protein
MSVMRRPGSIVPGSSHLRDAAAVSGMPWIVSPVIKVHRRAHHPGYPLRPSKNQRHPYEPKTSAQHVAWRFSTRKSSLLLGIMAFGTRHRLYPGRLHPSPTRHRGCGPRDSPDSRPATGGVMPVAGFKLWTDMAPTVSLTPTATSAGHDPGHPLRGCLARAVGIINAAALQDLGNEEMKRASV